MNENTITITLDEYKDLIAATERIATLKRFMSVNKYMNADDLAAILDINNAKETENETV